MRIDKLKCFKTIIQDEFTGLIYEPTNIRTNLKQTQMRTQKTVSVMQQVTRTVTQIAKQVKTWLQQLIKKKPTNSIPLNPKHTTLLINLNKVKTEKDQWEENYHRLRTALLEKEKIEKLIKSIL